VSAFQPAFKWFSNPKSCREARFECTSHAAHSLPLLDFMDLRRRSPSECRLGLKCPSGTTGGWVVGWCRWRWFDCFWVLLAAPGGLGA